LTTEAEGEVEAALARLPPGARILVQGCSGESRLLAGRVRAAGAWLDAPAFTGIRIPGVNETIWLPDADPGRLARFETFFMTATLAEERDRVAFLPLPYGDILRRLRSIRVDAAVFAVTPPDARGMCSFGPTVDFLAELWPSIPLRIAHINPLLPRTAGPTGIPRDAIHVAVEAPEAPVGLPDPPPDARSAAIARHVAGFVTDGATIQTGLGKLPGTILRELTDRRNLRMHTGLIGDAMLDLLAAGAIADGRDITTGVALGTQRLYDALPASGIDFRPVSHTHDPRILARIPGLVTINAAMSVDLYGQGYAEVAGGRWHSGTGGATDFARGAAPGGGLRIIALPASAGDQTRIVPPGNGAGPVSLSRTDIDVVVTEHGAADLRGKSHDARAAALVAIAHPDHRAPLARAWRDGPGRH
jgi:acyl-CoA hydrolase